VIEHAVEKLEVQPVVHDPTFIDPAGDADGATGFMLAVWCDTPPDDGDIAVYVAANDRFELRPQSALVTGTPVTIEDGMGGFLIVFDEDGDVVYA
jgi:hypothetical protein